MSHCRLIYKWVSARSFLATSLIVGVQLVCVAVMILAWVGLFSTPETFGADLDHHS